MRCFMVSFRVSLTLRLCSVIVTFSGYPPHLYYLIFKKEIPKRKDAKVVLPSHDTIQLIQRFYQVASKNPETLELSIPLMPLELYTV